MPGVVLLAGCRSDGCKGDRLGGARHFLFSVGYLQTYPALRFDIPSFRILMLLDAEGEYGLTESEIRERMSKEELFADRLADLERDLLVVKKDGKLELSAAGAVVAAVFAFYRRMLGWRMGLG